MTTVASFSVIEEEIRRTINLVESVRRMQRPDGSLASKAAETVTLLESLATAGSALYRQSGRADLADAFMSDFDLWRRGNWDGPPLFDAVQQTFSAPAVGATAIFVGPVIATNGPAPTGHFFECFVAIRDEPTELAALAERWPHPLNKCQPVRLQFGSIGFMRGNCIVFFPENIKTRSPVAHQEYALFFFNKFYKIYNTITRSRVISFFGSKDTLFGDQDWLSFSLDEMACYKARCMWGYLHDYFHHSGPRPLHLNLRAKLNWFSGLLEEIKVDCQAALAGLACGTLYGKAVFQFVVFERMLRYPCQPDCETNFDSGTGVFLFEWLRRSGVLQKSGTTPMRLVAELLTDAMRNLINKIEQIEQLQPDSEYKIAAKRFVREMLPESELGARFRMPASYREWFPINESAGLLVFDDLRF